MTYVSVRVIDPPNRDIYLDGDYTSPANEKPGGSFPVNAGGHIFETLDGQQRVDFYLNIDIGPSGEIVDITLEPVDPPRPIA